MKLFRIHVRHYGPKDNHSSIEGYILRETAEEVWEYVKKLSYVDDDPEYDDEEIGTETKKQRMLRLGGEFFDCDMDFSDLYYGITHYGWEEVKQVTEEEIALLRACEILDED